MVCIRKVHDVRCECQHIGLAGVGYRENQEFGRYSLSFHEAYKCIDPSEK